MAGVFKDGYLMLLRSGVFSDLVIECGSVEFKVHKAVVCAPSPMLYATCSGKFKVLLQVAITFISVSYESQESQTGRVKFPEDNPNIMSRAILFLYTGDYDADQVPNFNAPTQGEEHAPPTQANDEKNQLDALKTHILVYKCADMLGIEKLKALAAGRFLEQGWTALTEDDVADLLRLVYESTHSDDTTLRLPVTSLCVKMHATLSDAATKLM